MSDSIFSPYLNPRTISFLEAKLCDKCKAEVATEKHHLFSQTKRNKKLYGELIHDPSNIQQLCYNCHHNRPVDKISEEEFCRRVGIEPRSKTHQLKQLRGRQSKMVSYDDKWEVI